METLTRNVIKGHTFIIPERYLIDDTCKILGKGSFGLCCSAKDLSTDETIAVKRIRPYANDIWDAKHTLREIKLMRLLGSHPNIICLYDLSINNEKEELYMMLECMYCDLNKVIKQVELSDKEQNKIMQSCNKLLLAIQCNRLDN